MVRTIFVLLLMFAVAIPAVAQTASPTTRVDRSPHREGIADANGIKLHYLEWGGPNRGRIDRSGRGEALLFLTDMGATAHIFDNLAPRFTDRFRVLGLTRRGLGKSDKPEAGYDTATLAADIRGFLDAMKIRRVTLVGWSLAGTEMTRFAALYPARVSRLVYLDSAYDYANLPEIWAKDPVSNAPTKEDSASFESSRQWFIKLFGFWSDAVEADARAINLQPDGTMKQDPMPENITKQLMAGMVEAHPDFRAVKAPILAFYAVSQTHPGVLSTTDAETRRKGQAYWSTVFLPDQRKQIAELRSSVPAARIVEMQGTQHLCFIKQQDEDRIVREMGEFLRER